MNATAQSPRSFRINQLVFSCYIGMGTVTDICGEGTAARFLVHAANGSCGWHTAGELAHVSAGALVKVVDDEGNPYTGRVVKADAETVSAAFKNGTFKFHVSYVAGILPVDAARRLTVA